MADPYLSMQTFPADGETVEWEVAFAGNRPDAASGTAPYLDVADVEAVEVIPATASTAEVRIPREVTPGSGPNRFRVSPAVALGRNVRIQRRTQDQYNLVDFQNLQVVSEFDLDTANRQLLFVVQESRDTARMAEEAADRVTGTAYSAVLIANAATDTANEATNTANWATSIALEGRSIAEQAALDAIGAGEVAAGAVETAEGAVATANTALSTANAATTTAESAVDLAEEALDVATGIAGTAQSALDVANGIAGTAQDALDTANGIDAKATEALSTAGAANTTAGTALSTANSATAAAANAVQIAEDALEAVTGEAVLSVNGRTGNVTVTKADVGLSNVNNTSDANKPVSTAVAEALAPLAPKNNSVLTGATRVEKLELEGGQHCLTTNDGGGNFNLRVGHKFVSGVGNVYTSGGGAVHMNIAHENAGWPSVTFNLARAASDIGQGAGSGVSFSTMLSFDNNSLKFGTHDVWHAGNFTPTDQPGQTIRGNLTVNSGTCTVEAPGATGNIHFYLSDRGTPKSLMFWERATSSTVLRNLNGNTITGQVVMDGNARTLELVTWSTSGARQTLTLHPSGNLTIPGHLHMGAGGENQIHIGPLNAYLYGNNTHVGMFRAASGALANLNVNNGDWTASGNIVARSDGRLKTDVVVIAGALDKVQRLRGVTYRRTDIAAAHRHVGLIAQEVQSVVPEAVTVEEDSAGTLNVAYGNLVGLLVEAIKELRAEVADLRAKAGG